MSTPVLHVLDVKRAREMLDRILLNPDPAGYKVYPHNLAYDLNGIKASYGPNGVFLAIPKNYVMLQNLLEAVDVAKSEGQSFSIQLY